MEPAGRDPGRAFCAPRSGTRDALFPEEVQSFPDNFSARLGVGGQRQGLNADPGTVSVTIPIRPPLDSLGCFLSESANRQRTLNLKVNDHGFPLLKLQDVFDDAAANRVERTTGARASHPSLVTGMVFDEGTVQVAGGYRLAIWKAW
jgi:hypothetical protein